MAKIKILFYPAISLDGFIAKPDGDSSWVTDEDERIFSEEVRKAGCVIVGRKTFEQYKGIIYPVADAMTFVCTSCDHLEPMDGINYIKGEVNHIVKQIERAGFESAVLSGGADTNGRFAQANAIDEMLISIYPQTLGEGLSMFGTKPAALQLKLLGSRTLGQGIVQNRYSVRR